MKVKSSVFLLIYVYLFYRVLKFYTIIVCLFLLWVLSVFAFYILGHFCYVHNHLGLLRVLINWPFYHYWMSIFMNGQILWTKDYLIFSSHCHFLIITPLYCISFFTLFLFKIRVLHILNAFLVNIVQRCMLPFLSVWQPLPFIWSTWLFIFNFLIWRCLSLPSFYLFYICWDCSSFIFYHFLIFSFRLFFNSFTFVVDLYLCFSL